MYAKMKELGLRRSPPDLWTQWMKERVGQIDRVALKHTACAKSLQSCPNLCDPVDCSPSGSSVHRILQARILECHSLLQGIFRTQRWKPGLLHCRQIFTIWATREAPKHTHYHVQNRQLMGSCFVTQGAQPGALWQPRGVGWGWVRWRFKTEGTHVYLWLIHIVVWQKPTEHCKEIILWLKINFTKSAESI